MSLLTWRSCLRSSLSPRGALFEDLRFAAPAVGLTPVLRAASHMWKAPLASSIVGLDGRRGDLAEDDLCGLPLGVVWPWLAEAPLLPPLLQPTHEVVPPPPLSPDPGVLDCWAGAAKDQWVSLLLVLFCDIALATVLHTTACTPVRLTGSRARSAGCQRQRQCALKGYRTTVHPFHGSQSSPPLSTPPP